MDMLPFEPLSELLLFEKAPEKRRAYCPSEHDGHEHRLSEAAVMLAFANHLFRCGATEVTIHPDGMHGKQFAIGAWLARSAFVLDSLHGRTGYGGTYSRGNQVLHVTLLPGHGDVSAVVDGESIIAECKGGVINSRHSGVRSTLRSGLREAVGSLLERTEAGRQVAVVPEAAETRTFSERMAKRAAKAGIEIALVTRHGEVRFVTP